MIYFMKYEVCKILRCTTIYGIIIEYFYGTS